MYLEQEWESLKAVLEIKNERLHQRDVKWMKMEKLVDDNKHWWTNWSNSSRSMKNLQLRWTSTWRFPGNSPWSRRSCRSRWRRSARAISASPWRRRSCSGSSTTGPCAAPRGPPHPLHPLPVTSELRLLPQPQHVSLRWPSWEPETDRRSLCRTDPSRNCTPPA